MDKVKRRIIRHILVVVCFLLAVLGGFIPIFQGWVFLALAIILLAIDYRWVRDLVLRRLYRRHPEKYRAASRWRRRVRLKWCRRFRRKSHSRE